MVLERDERVLQRRARARVRVNVAGRHRPQLQPARELRAGAVARAVMPLEGALELHAQAIGRERLAQLEQRRFVLHPVIGAAAQADEALGVLDDGRERNGRRRLARVAIVHVGARDDPAQVAPALVILDEQRQVAGGPDASRESGVPSAGRARASSGSQRSISTPWMARRPSGSADIANSIEPETPLWSVSAIAS